MRVLDEDIYMRNRLWHFSSKSQRGQSVVEFALVIPVFLMLIFGIIDFTRYYMREQAMSHLLRATARYAATGKTLEDPSNPGTQLSRRDSILKYAEDAIAPGGDATLGAVGFLEIEIPVDSADPTNDVLHNFRLDPYDGGDYLTITFEQDFNFITPFVTDNVFNGTISSKIRIVNERF